jgi:hypothetical protein
MGHGEAALNGALCAILEIEVDEPRHDAVGSALFYEVQGSEILHEEVLVEHVQE